ncbi:hypothetical protein V8B97DRAFT_780916 [Scleroderma yunnanense]
MHSHGSTKFTHLKLESNIQRLQETLPIDKRCRLTCHSLLSVSDPRIPQLNTQARYYAKVRPVVKFGRFSKGQRQINELDSEDTEQAASKWRRYT